MLPLAMIDYFALLLVHGLLFIALFRLMLDDSVDSEALPGSTEPAPGDKPAATSPQDRRASRRRT